MFDEGEQGQPAFVFERDGDRGHFSIAASELSEVGGDPEWERVGFMPGEFVAAYNGLRASFVTMLRHASPDTAEVWLARYVGE